MLAHLRPHGVRLPVERIVPHREVRPGQVRLDVLGEGHVPGQSHLLGTVQAVLGEKQSLPCPGILRQRCEVTRSQSVRLAALHETSRRDDTRDRVGHEGLRTEGLEEAVLGGDRQQRARPAPRLHSTSRSSASDQGPSRGVWFLTLTTPDPPHDRRGFPWPTLLGARYQEPRRPNQRQPSTGQARRSPPEAGPASSRQAG